MNLDGFFKSAVEVLFVCFSNYTEIYMNCSQPGSSCPCGFPGKNAGMGCRFPLEWIFLTQGLNLSLPHYRQILYHLIYQEREKNTSTKLGIEYSWSSLYSQWHSLGDGVAQRLSTQFSGCSSESQVSLITHCCFFLLVAVPLTTGNKCPCHKHLNILRALCCNWNRMSGIFLGGIFMFYEDPSNLQPWEF